MSTGITRRAFMGAGAAGAAVVGLSGSAQGATESYGPIPLAKASSWKDLHTPALLLDADAMERNLAKMVAFTSGAGGGVKLRPHTKTHKCPHIARKQVELGAIGVCCAKVSEAEVMQAGGIENILITSPVASAEKIERVIALSKNSAGIQMVVDDLDIAKAFGKAAKSAGVTQRVLVDLNTGTQRTGVRLGEDTVKLCKAVSKLKNLRFDGLQAYSGHLMHVHDHGTRKTMTEKALERVLETKAMVEDAGIEVGVLTGGGTGTFDVDGAMTGFTDLQTGSYLFMDTQYRAIGDSDSETFDFFEPSLFVVLTAISEPVPGKLITMDGGYKSFASDAIPEFVDDPGLIYTFGGDEHGIVRVKNAKRPPKLGEKFRLIVSHCDPTVNLYDEYHVMRDGKVVERWPIAARGRSQ